MVVVVSQFNGTSTPKGSYSANTGDNDCNVNSSRYSLRTAMCESIRYQAKAEENVRQDLIPTPRGGCSHAPLNAHMESVLMNVLCYYKLLLLRVGSNGLSLGT